MAYFEITTCAKATIGIGKLHEFLNGFKGLVIFTQGVFGCISAKSVFQATKIQSTTSWQQESGVSATASPSWLVGINGDDTEIGIFTEIFGAGRTSFLELEKIERRPARRGL